MIVTKFPLDFKVSRKFMVIGNIQNIELETLYASDNIVNYKLRQYCVLQIYFYIDKRNHEMKTKSFVA